MEEEKNKRLAEYRGRELKEKEDYPPLAEIQAEYDHVEEEIGLRDYIDVLLRRKWIIVFCLIFSVVTVAIASLMMDKVYKAEATIEIAPESPKITSFQEVVDLGVQTLDLEAFYETQYQLIKSKSLAKEVINELKLDSRPGPASPVKEEKTPGLILPVKNAISRVLSGKRGEEAPDLKGVQGNDLVRGEGLINSFLAGVQVIPDRKSRLVKVSYESSDPELSARAVNTLAGKYIEWILERKLDATKSAREFLERQLEQAKAKLERAEEELSIFAKNKDIVSLDEDLNLTYKQLAELNAAFSESETERLSKEALYKQAQSGDYIYLPQIMNDPSIQALNEEYTKLSSQHDHMAVVYGPNYPDIKQLRAQLERVKSEIKQRTGGFAESIKKDYQTALAKENILRQRTEEQTRRAGKLNEETIQYKILEREVETNKSIYQNLLQRLKETEVTSAIEATNVQVVDYASPPLVPYKPNIKSNIFFAVMIGFVAGCCLAFIIEHFDGTIKDEEEVKRRFSLPFLGAVPLAEGEDSLMGIEKAVYTDPRSLVSEAFRVIRTSILYSSPDHPPKSLLITSTQPLEGKTTSASNLALSMVQSGLKVVLIDADLRKPRLHKVFLSNGNTFGLSTYLVGKMSLSGVIKQTDIESLNIIPSGPIPPNPAELLGSKRMKELIELLLEEYDHVIVDGAPVTGFADSRLLSRLVDGVLLVTSIGITQKQILRNCIEEISRVRGRIIGTVVNRLESRRGKYGYSYYYYYGDDKGKGRKRPSLHAPRS